MDTSQPTPTRRIKVPHGYPHAGRIGRVIAETAETVDVHVHTRTVRRIGRHKDAIVTVNVSDITDDSAASTGRWQQVSA